MFYSFQQNLKATFSNILSKRILLATSGGVDSMVMLDLFLKTFNKEQLAVAHCNFQLRSNESEEDATFIQDFCKLHQIEFFSKRFNVQEFKDSNSVSVQMAARELRYKWFEELLKSHCFDFLATAHHLNDQAETFLMHLIRGTGLDGLQGIPEKNNFIIRPLLNFSREDILSYANKNRLNWREDSSNESIKYFRNSVRHQIIPLFKEKNPSFLQSFQETLNHLKDSKQLIEDALEHFKTSAMQRKNDGIYFDIDKVKKFKNHAIYLYEILKSYGFHSKKELSMLLLAQSGKGLVSQNYCLLKNRNHLILERKNNSEDVVYQIDKINQKLNLPIILKFNYLKENSNEIFSKNEICIDAEKVSFPLYLRKKRMGDFFYPTKMLGKKKLSKYFKDEKFSIFDKEKIWVLTTNDHEIIWIIGHRADRRFEIQPNTQSIIKITTT